jgi:hypothetical protein
VLPDKQAAKRPDRRATYYNSQVSTQVIGDLLIHVLRSPHPPLARRWRFDLPRGQSIFRIWPPTGYSIGWPTGTLDDVSASRIADAFKVFWERISAEARPKV